jgi:hypothetical protein
MTAIFWFATHRDYKNECFIIKRGAASIVISLIYWVIETQQGVLCYNKFSGCCPNDGHLLDFTLCGVLYLFRVLEECSVSIFRVTKQVLVGADIIGWKKMSQFHGKVWRNLVKHSFLSIPAIGQIIIITYFLPPFHLSIHLGEFWHSETRGSTFLQNIITHKKHITWYKIPKVDLNLYLTIWHYIAGTGEFRKIVHHTMSFFC